MRLFVNVYWPVLNNVVYVSRESAAAGAMPYLIKARVEVEFPGSIDAAARELADFSADGLRAHFPIPSSDILDGPNAFGVAAAASKPPRLLTLPMDSEARKNIPLVAGFLRYCPAAVVKFAEHSKAGNDKHNKGEPIHHARWKSTDHEECLFRHLVDIQDFNAHIARGTMPSDEAIKALISEATAEFWRAGIFLQELCEKYEGAPLAPGARVQEQTVDRRHD